MEPTHEYELSVTMPRVVFDLMLKKASTKKEVSQKISIKKMAGGGVLRETETEGEPTVSDFKTVHENVVTYTNNVRLVHSVEYPTSVRTETMSLPAGHYGKMDIFSSSPDSVPLEKTRVCYFIETPEFLESYAEKTRLSTETVRGKTVNYLEIELREEGYDLISAREELGEVRASKNMNHYMSRLMDNIYTSLTGTYGYNCLDSKLNSRREKVLSYYNTKGYPSVVGLNNQGHRNMEMDMKDYFITPKLDGLRQIATLSVDSEQQVSLLMNDQKGNVYYRVRSKKARESAVQASMTRSRVGAMNIFDLEIDFERKVFKVIDLVHSDHTEYKTWGYGDRIKHCRKMVRTLTTLMGGPGGAESDGAYSLDTFGSDYIPLVNTEKVKELFHKLGFEGKDAPLTKTSFVGGMLDLAQFYDGVVIVKNNCSYMESIKYPCIKIKPDGKNTVDLFYMNGSYSCVVDIDGAKYPHVLFNNNARTMRSERMAFSSIGVMSGVAKQRQERGPLPEGGVAPGDNLGFQEIMNTTILSGFIYECLVDYSKFPVEVTPIRPRPDKTYANSLNVVLNNATLHNWEEAYEKLFSPKYGKVSKLVNGLKYESLQRTRGFARISMGEGSGRQTRWYDSVTQLIEPHADNFMKLCNIWTDFHNCHKLSWQDPYPISKVYANLPKISFHSFHSATYVDTLRLIQYIEEVIEAYPDAELEFHFVTFHDIDLFESNFAKIDKIVTKESLTTCHMTVASDMVGARQDGVEVSAHIHDFERVRQALCMNDSSWTLEVVGINEDDLAGLAKDKKKMTKKEKMMQTWGRMQSLFILSRER